MYVCVCLKLNFLFTKHEGAEDGAGFVFVKGRGGGEDFLNNIFVGIKGAGTMLAVITELGVVAFIPVASAPSPRRALLLRICSLTHELWRASPYAVTLWCTSLAGRTRGEVAARPPQRVVHERELVSTAQRGLILGYGATVTGG